MEKPKHSNSSGKIIKQCICFGKQCGSFSKCQLTCDPAFPLLGVRPRELKTHVHIKSFTSIFIAILFIIVKKKEIKPKCPLTDEWINKMWHIHPMEYYQAIKKNAHVSQIKLINRLLREKSQGSPLSLSCSHSIPLGWNVLSIHSYEMFRIGKSIQAESR